MNDITKSNSELHSYETFFTSLAWIQGGIITWMYAAGTPHKAALAIIAACALTTLLGASTLTYHPKNSK
ncbi:hypothetical protein PHL092M00_38 [Propionibacterium phage PHL092M00]|uniref:Uncharacterized protein n=1 Tax=Propionibacterium phage PHL092M00 TaxID=1500813 RepID=A0A0E3DN03_9CAUD|nr:hypothetical protein ACQ75_gp38 [Propionibacterium phage PHL092M00]AII29301.1 hypothetical protein PHL092M00_38 [Propionibacterium phage PHL092M00]